MNNEVLILSGWCMVIGSTPHVNCVRRFKSSMTGKTYVCPCECHTANDEALEELI